MDDKCINPLSRFRVANPDNPSFFKSLKERQIERNIREKLEDVLGPLPDNVFDRIKIKAQENFEMTVMEYLDNPTTVEAGPIEHEKGSPPTIEYNDEEESMYCYDINEDKVAIDRSAFQTKLENEEEAGDVKPVSATGREVVESAETEPVETEPVEPEPVEPEASQPTNPWKDGARFIGSLQAEVWCTRSGKNLVRFNEKLKIDRAGTSSVSSTATTAAPARSAKQKDDVIVRFYNSEGLYFARAQESDARFMSVLIDAKVCQFDATVIYADQVLRLGSTIYVQVDCYLKHEAFSTMSSFSVDLKGKKKNTLFDESKESREEKLIRLRQLALVNLFNRLGLIESNVDMTQAILEANSVSQARLKSPSSTSRGSSPTPPPPCRPNSNAEEAAEEEGEELNEDQLELFYNNAVSAPKNVEGAEVDPPESFALDLFPYQKRGLAWMLDRERVVGQVDEADSETHPLWTELQWPEKDVFWANLNSGELSLVRPTLALRSRGGILADEMGLGKTISALALIHAAAEESKFHSTLVVAPMSLLSQWESEIQKAAKSPKDCGSFIYYGNSSSAGVRTALSEFMSNAMFKHRIVVTTYGMISSEHKQRHLMKQGGIFNTTFDRIILDEAHTMKNRSTQTAKACFDLRGHRRWVLTGTPVVNRLEDLYSLIRFIGIEPWNNFTFWRAFITEQFQRADSRERAMKTVQAVVAPICLRRTKAMRDPITNKQLVELPKKRVEIKRIMFSEEEKTLYSHLYARVRESVQVKVLEGTASSKYSTILALLLRLRQVCCHPLLLRKSFMESAVTALDAAAATTATPNTHASDIEESVTPPSKKIKPNPVELAQINEDLRLDLTSDVDALLQKFSATPSLEYTAETLKNLLENPLENQECSICSEDQKDPVLTACLHSACRDCLMSHIDYLKRRGDNPLCHICRAPIDSSQLFVVNAAEKRLQPLNQGLQSSKVRALIASLRNAASQGYGKAVVFSQFTSFLDLIELNLNDAGFQVYRFDGSMSQAQRAVAVDGFRSSKRKDAVLLLSQKAGGVGLNLVVANHAYLMDPWWNFANESQAIDRIHRMGQKDNVIVTRFIIQGSIEERMLKIQERKHALSNLVTEEERRADNLENIRLLLDLGDINTSEDG